MRIEVLKAWPGVVERRTLVLDEGGTVADALRAVPDLLEDVAGYAVFGVRAEPDAVLRDGDRLELLRPLQIDPKDARRRRAAARAAR